MKISVVSGGFDPIHSGHISYFMSAKKISDYLIVALNSDEWLIRKKKKFFMPLEERKNILDNIECIDEVMTFTDDEHGTCINALEQIKKKFPKDKIIFCNGGDRDHNNIPEMAVNNIDFKFGIGGKDKKNSSSRILKNWKYDYEEKLWGIFYNLFDSPEVKVKELVVSPKKAMSLKQHIKRDKIWLVTKGSFEVIHLKGESNLKTKKILNKFDIFNVLKGEWHQIINPFAEECRIIEIQYGDSVIEEGFEN